MPALNQEEKALFGSSISPFERSIKSEEKKILRDGESSNREFQDFIHDAIEDGKPDYNYVEVTDEEIELYIKPTGRYKEKCFLWIIDEISIKILREKTRNVLRTFDPECVCHTNLTGGEKAFAGGELFFGEDGNIYINPFSDRYGNLNSQQWETVLSYFKRVGYDNLIDILELLENQEK